MSSVNFRLIFLCALCALKITAAFEETVTTTNRPFCDPTSGWKMTGVTYCIYGVQSASGPGSCCGVCLAEDSCRGYYFLLGTSDCYCVASWTGWEQTTIYSAGTMEAPSDK